MLKIEKVKLTTGLQTDVSPKVVDTQGNRLVTNPILEAVNARYVMGDEGMYLIFQSVKGNTKVTNSDLPSGTNIVIGSVEDVQNNALVYFVYNSNGNHGVYKYSQDSGTISTIMKSSFLNFQNNPRYLITGAGIFGNMLYWSDGINPQRAINMTRDYSSITSDKPITLIKEHPLTRPDVLGSSTTTSGHPFFRENDASIKFNKIADKNLQFSYQYVFIDNEKSVIAPISKLAYASPTPSADLLDTNKNVIPYRTSIPSDILPFVKQILLLVREGNTGAWSIWKKITPSGSSISTTYTGYEANEEISDADASKIQEAVPTISKALCVHRNRVMVSCDEEGFNVSSNVSMSITEQFEDYTSGPSRNTYFKFGGARTFGLALFDDRGRSMGVFNKKNINFSQPTNQNNVIDAFEIGTNRPYVTINLSGNLSGTPKAKYYSIVCTDENYYDDYMQVPVLVYPYRYEKGSAGLLAGEFEVDGRVYFGSPTNATQFNKIHLLLPKEAPFIPTDEYFVRLRSQLGNAPYSTATIEKIIAVEGSQFVVVNNLNITNWSGTRILFVEIFKPKQQTSNIFYEISDRFSVSGGALSQTSFTVYGDQYYVSSAVGSQQFTFRQDAADSSGAGFTPAVLKRVAKIESPTPTYGFETQWKIPSESKSTNLITADRKILDYSQKGWNRGKPFLELLNPVALNRKTVIRFSNPAIQDTFINGMSNFDSGDEKVLPVDRTPITKFVPVGNNVLAVHERSLTTLYIEQSMIKNVEGAEQLITTDRFIGYDRELSERVGSYHPESVAEYLGIVFGFDVFKGIVWQYSNEGASIISRFGREKFFERIADLVRPIKDTCKVVGGIDPKLKEYVISFVFPAPYDDQNITLGYNWEKNFWTVEYQAVPEFYAKINRSLISFKSGELWVHNTNPLFNNFYGVQYQRRLKIAVNPYPSRSKNWMGIQISTNLLSSGADPEMMAVKCYTEDGQETYMKVDDFEKLEGVFYGPILKDINTLPALIPAGKIALRDGEDMLGKYIIVELINDHATDSCPIQFLNLTYADSEYTQ